MDVCIVDLAKSAPLIEAIDAREAWYPAADRARVQQLADGLERRQRMACYGALRLLLERRCGPDAARRPFAIDQNGKPFIPGAQVAFSIAHSDGWAALAIAPHEPIGIDIELPRARQIAEPRRDRLLAAARGLAGARLPPDTIERQLLQAWVRLEACAKANGGGIARLLTALGVRGGPAEAGGDAVIEACAGDYAAQAGLQIADVPGHIAAVAAARGMAIPVAALFPTDWTALEHWRRS